MDFFILWIAPGWIYAFIAFAIFTAIRQKPFSTIAGIKDYKNWTPVKVHKISKSIIAEAGASKPILTLTPLYAIEGGGQIYRQLSAGAFAFRAAGKLSQEEQTITHSAGLGQICKIIKEYPPAAIVIGPELTRFEKIDLKSLVPEDWQKTNFGDVHCFFPSKN